MITLSDIEIRHDLRPGDLGYLTWLHGTIYHRENGYSLAIESYVAGGLHEFYTRYDPARDRVWVCEHEGKMIGFMLLMHRDHNAAQLRYFILQPDYRGIGLGKHLMEQFMAFLIEKNYDSAYLWTTNEQEQASALYRRHGFELVEEVPSTAFGKALTEQKFEWRRPEW